LCFAGQGELEKLILEHKIYADITIAKNSTQMELSDLYAASKFVILPSRQEGFGLVISEAMYCGTPAIANATGGIVEQIKDQHNGFLVNNSVNSWIEIVLKTMSLNGLKYSELSNNALNSNKKHRLSEVCLNLRNNYLKLV
jgi:glycosyltransferase involved in cell wall biosynthesis